MTAQTPEVLKTYFEKGDRPTSAQYTDLIDTAFNYKLYVALFTQVTTIQPNVITLENMLGGSVVWNLTSTGVFDGTLAGAFPDADKVAFFPARVAYIDNNGVVTYLSVSRVDANTIRITTTTAAGAAKAADINNLTIEIRVYP